MFQHLSYLHSVPSEPLGTFPISFCGTTLSGQTHILCRDISTSILAQEPENHLGGGSHLEGMQICRIGHTGGIPTMCSEVLQCSHCPPHFTGVPIRTEPTCSSSLAQQFLSSQQPLLSLVSLLNHGHTGCVFSHGHAGELADPRSLSASGRR